MRKLLLLFATLTVFMASCERQPPLHLYDSAEVDFTLPLIDLQLDVYWNYDLNYELTYDVKYDWRAEWYYGWRWATWSLTSSPSAATTQAMCPTVRA